MRLLFHKILQIYFLFAMAFLLMLYSAELLAETSGSITVNVTGISDKKGNVFVALTKTVPEFEDKSGDIKPYKSSVVAATGPEVSVVFLDTEPGEYALKIFHDANANGKFDTNFVGMPVEDYGFSNQARSLFGPPSYEEAKFSVAKVHSEVTVRVR